jgi:hypothetical protein
MIRRRASHSLRSPDRTIASMGLACAAMAALLVGAGAAEATAPSAVVAPAVVGDGILGSWSALGSSTDLRVNALLMKDDTLYAGGDFASAGGVSGTSRIAAWSTSTQSWHALGAGVNSSVWSMAAHDDTVYVGGVFTAASGIASTAYVAAWSQRDDTWVAVTPGTSPDNQVSVVAAWGDDTLAVGGYFTTPQTRFSPVVLSTGTWTSGPIASPSDRLEAFAVQGTSTATTADDTLYVGGPLTTPSGNVAALTPGGSTWASVGGGLGNEVRALALQGGRTADPFDDTLYAGGYFTDAGGSAGGDYIAAWSSASNTWSPLGPGLNAQPVLAIVVDDTRGLVYAGGDFTQEQGGAANSMSKVGVWDSGISAWIPLKFGAGSTENGVNSTVEALALDDSVVYVGGNFTSSGSAVGVSSITRVARWTWDPPTGTSSDDTAYPGDTITLSGQGLIGVTSVRIGDDTQASFTRDDSATIQVTVPAGTFRDDTIYVDAVGGVGEFGAFTSWPTIPEPPLTPVAEAGDAAASVEWTPPPSDGGSTIASYTATATPGGASCTTTTTGCTVSGLSNGASYTFRVQATNPQGASDPSSASNSVTPVATPVVPQPPGAPGQVLATAGDRSALVAWSAPSSTGSFTVSTYQVMSSPGGKSCLTSTTSCTISGLTNGTAYTFTVKALSGAGWGTPSAPSNTVTPRSPAEMSISITGSRAGRTVKVSGTTKGIETGSELVAWARLGNAADFAPGRRPAVVRDGEFTWQRRASRSVTLYFEFEETSSNRVTIPAHSRPTRGR